MAARDPYNPIPYEDEDHNSLPPPCGEQISLDIEAFDRRIAAMEKLGWSKSDTSVHWMETAVRKELYRVGQGKTFEYAPEVNSTEKKSLQKLFTDLGGHRWNRKFGWAGQVRDNHMTHPSALFML